MFTYEEINLMCIYDTSSREGLISNLTEMRKYLDSDETELLELTDSALRKLKKISGKDFSELELFADFEEDEDAD